MTYNVFGGTLNPTLHSDTLLSIKTTRGKHNGPPALWDDDTMVHQDYEMTPNGPPALWDDDTMMMTANSDS